MDFEKGEEMKRKSDYFASELLAKLDTADPVFAAYEAQDVSREVGFDFADFQETLVRGLDEIRETLEAQQETGAEGRNHYGDEIADIIFSLINLARHAGIKDLPTFKELEAASALIVDDKDPIDIFSKVGKDMQSVGRLESENDPQFSVAVENLLRNGAAGVIKAAQKEGFEPKTLLTENVRKYLLRCQAIETLAEADGKQWADLAAAEEIITYWKRAKNPES